MNLPPLFSSNFPSYTKECYKCNIDIVWYTSNFSQSSYPPGQKVSQACTLICLIVAQLICDISYKIRDIENCSALNIIIARAIIKGNAIHERITQQGLISHPYLNIEEALLYSGNNLNILKEWEFRVIQENIEITLCENIQNFLNKWYRNPKSSNLFMFLITCGRTILFIFQEKTQKVTFFDPHGHKIVNSKSTSQVGLVVAQTTLDHLELMCDWYVKVILSNYCNIKVNQYELAFLYNDKKLKSTTRNCICES